MNKKFIKLDREEAELLCDVILNADAEYEIFKSVEYNLLNGLQKASNLKEFDIPVDDCVLKITVTENHIFIWFFSMQKLIIRKTDIRRKDRKIIKHKKSEVKL